MTYKKYLPTLVCGFGAAVLSTVPGIKNFSCCLLVPAAAAFSILLDKKINQSNEKVQLSKGYWIWVSDRTICYSVYNYF